jgi:hypothetical protein
MSKREKVVRAFECWATWDDEHPGWPIILCVDRAAAKEMKQYGHPSMEVVRVEIRVVQPKARKKARKS